MLSNHECPNAKLIHAQSGSIVLSETECAHELEKSQLLLGERNKEIKLLKQQITHLQETNALLKASK